MTSVKVTERIFHRLFTPERDLFVSIVSVRLSFLQRGGEGHRLLGREFRSEASAVPQSFGPLPEFVGRFLYGLHLPVQRFKLLLGPEEKRLISP